MQVIYDSTDNSFQASKNVGVGLGNFDGVHIGHAALINTLVSECMAKDLNSMIYTFDQHTQNILNNKPFIAQIISEKTKIQLFRELDLDYLYFAKFDQDFSRMLPEEFIKEILVNILKVKLIVVGYNYRFGFEGKGDVHLLKHCGNKYGYDAIVVPPIKINDNAVSSTLVRSTIANGNIKLAAELLGRPYSLQGIVVKGRQVGQKIGFPTANIIIEPNLIVPQNGIYLTDINIDGKSHKSLTNIGNNPTFNLNDRSIETHIFDFNQNIYEKDIEILFNQKIRDEIKFDTVQQLAEQINRDVLLAKSITK
jgi:riboflavin kinase/FMN adenylyltransferase